MSELFQVFPIPIYCNKAEGDTFEEIQEELKSVCDKLEFAQMENWSRDSHELNKDPFEGNILEKYNCDMFKRKKGVQLGALFVAITNDVI